MTDRVRPPRVDQILLGLVGGRVGVRVKVRVRGPGWVKG